MKNHTKLKRSELSSSSTQWPQTGNPAVQMVLPLAEMIGWLRKGVSKLIRRAGLQLIGLLMQEGPMRRKAGEGLSDVSLLRFRVWPGAVSEAPLCR